MRILQTLDTRVHHAPAASERMEDGVGCNVITVLEREQTTRNRVPQIN